MSELMSPPVNNSKRPVQDSLATVVIWMIVASVTGLFLWLLGDIFWNGVGQLSWSFLTEPPRSAGRAGGIGSILVSTILILFVCMVTVLPLGLGTAVFLSEFTSMENLFGRMVRRSLDLLAGVPSIVFGLFGNIFFCIYLKMGFSILSGGLTLACMVLPILIRSTEEGLRSVPNEYRLGATALGMSRTTMLICILMPAAMPGLVVGLILGIGRAIAETAALIFTSGYVDRMPDSLMDSGRSLSIHIFDLSMNVAGGDPNAYASALILIVMLIVINALASTITHRCLHRNLFSV